MSKAKPQYIFLAGGLSAGPIMPLLAVAKEWHHEHRSVVPIIFDVKNSVAEQVAKQEHHQFHRIITGKLRRYWSWRNLFSPLLLLIGFGQALYFMGRYRPIAVLGAGGFVQTPLVLAAWLYRIPRFIHQQDVMVTLTNSLCAPLANLVTVTFESSIRDFPQGTGLGKKYVTTDKVIWTGNPTPAESETEQKLTAAAAKKQFGLHNELPVLLVVGGGTGAQGINDLIYKALPQLINVVQIIHATGRGKKQYGASENYHPYEYIADIAAAYSACDIVLSRAGLGALSSIAQHKKPAIIIPMPNSHQERNAELVFKHKAALVFDETEVEPNQLITAIRDLLFKPELVKELTANMRELFPRHASRKVYTAITKYLDHHASK